MQQNRLIALITALALSACGGNDVSLSLSGPGININTQHYGSRSPNRPGFTPNPNSQNNNRATSPAANWRRLNGMVATTARTDGDNIQRYFPDTSGCRDCAAIPSADRRLGAERVRPGDFFDGAGVDAVYLHFHKANEFLGMKPLSTYICNDVVKNPQIARFLADYTTHLQRLFPA